MIRWSRKCTMALVDWLPAARARACRSCCAPPWRLLARFISRVSKRLGDPRAQGCHLLPWPGLCGLPLLAERRDTGVLMQHCATCVPVVTRRRIACACQHASPVFRPYDLHGGSSRHQRPEADQGLRRTLNELDLIRMCVSLQARLRLRAAVRSRRCCCPPRAPTSAMPPWMRLQQAQQGTMLWSPCMDTPRLPAALRLRSGMGWRGAMPRMVLLVWLQCCATRCSHI